MPCYSCKHSLPTLHIVLSRRCAVAFRAASQYDSVAVGCRNRFKRRLYGVYFTASGAYDIKLSPSTSAMKQYRSRRWRTLATTHCITGNVLQTKVDAECDKLATELS